MLQEVFYWLFSMSITAAISGVFIFLIRLIKKIPRRVTVFLWIIPFLRMILPFGLNSPYSFMSLLTRFSTKTVVVYRPVKNVAFSFMNHSGAAISYFPVVYKVDLLEQVFRVASVIWIIGSIAILLFLTGSYCRSIREVKGAINRTDNIFISDKIQSPAVYGILKPRIIIPEFYEDDQFDYVLLHEKVHIRRHDNLWRLIAFGVTAIHWFNPISWLILKGFLADLELSCDEHVLRKLDAAQRKEYALSLLECKRNSFFITSGFGGAKLHTRVKNILSFQKMTWFSMIIFLIMLCSMAYVLLTNSG